MIDPDPALLYFRDIVEPTVAEFMAGKADRRRGVLAALALASMTEHFFHARPALGNRRQDLEAFKEAVRQPPTGNGAVGLIADVANATRHVVRVPRGASVRLGFGDVRVAKMAALGVFRAGWPIGGEEVLVGADMEWRLSVLIEAAIAFWIEKLGLQPKPPQSL